MWENDTPEYWEDRMYSYEQCCRTCRFFYYGDCRIADEYDYPSYDGSDCCDKWESRDGRH